MLGLQENGNRADVSVPFFTSYRDAAARRALAERVLRPVQVALFVSGLALLAFYSASRVHAVLGQAQSLEAFAVAQSAQAVVANPLEVDPPAAPGSHETLPNPDPDQSLWDQSRIAAYRESLHAATDVPVGVLTIAAIHLRVPILEGTGDVTLNRGVGRIEGTARVGARGNLGIAGHRDGFFRGLKNVTVGDSIDIQSLDGSMRYRVSELLIVEPSDVYVLDPTDEATLTLVTCYPFYFIGSAPQRYIVKAVAALK